MLAISCQNGCVFDFTKHSCATLDPPPTIHPAPPPAAASSHSNPSIPIPLYDVSWVPKKQIRQLDSIICAFVGAGNSESKKVGAIATLLSGCQRDAPGDVCHRECRHPS